MVSLPSDTTTQPRRPRRALLAGALGGLGALAAGAVARVSPTWAANGDPVLVGASHDGTSVTTITNTSNAANAHAFKAVATAGTPGNAITGSSAHGNGVVGETNEGYGVLGTSSLSPGVRGVSGMGSGVEGRTDNQFAYGVGGSTTASGGTGVGGVAFGPGSKAIAGFTSGGAALYGEVPPGGEDEPGIGHALETVGRLKFSTSGIAIIVAGSTRSTVSPGVDVVPGSFVLLTPKTNLAGRDFWVTTDSEADTFTVHISSPRPRNMRFAWLLVG